MALGSFFKSVEIALQDYHVLIAAALVAACISIYIMLDAHRGKKKRPRHRWK